MKILLIEDEILIAEPTEEMLKLHHHQVDVAYDGEDGLSFGLSGLYDLILLDIMLPKMDGLEVLRELRRSGIKTPVIMLTAKGQLEDKIKGLDEGADDYLPKPYDYSELLARMNAISRRVGLRDAGNVLTFADVELNPQTLILKSEAGHVKLRLKESQLLELLMARKQMVTPKELIIDKLWDLDSEVEMNNVEYHVSTVRKQLRAVHSKVAIKAERGHGYYLTGGDHEN